MLSSTFRRLFAPMFLSSALMQAHAPMQPPTAPKKEHREVRHGAQVTDEYFWMREKSNPDVVRYLEAENAYTEAATRDIAPFAEALYKEMLGRVKQTDMGVPYRRGRYYYYSRTEEGQQYPILCRRPGTPEAMDAAAPEDVLLDLNELAKGKAFLSLGEAAVSDDDQRLAFTTDITGFRQYALRLKDLRSGRIGEPLAERVTSVVWAEDGRTLFYTTEDAVTKRSNQLWRHVLGTERHEPVYEEKDEHFAIGLSRTRDRKYLMLDIASTDTTEVRYVEAGDPNGALRVLRVRKKGHKYEADHRDGRFYIRTNEGAKNYRLVTAPVSAPGRWKAFLPHRPDTLLVGLELFQDHAVLCERQGGLDRLRVLDFASGKWRGLAFPEPVYSLSSASNQAFDTTRFRYGYQSLVTPASVYEVHMGTGASVLLKQQEVLGGYDPSRYVSERLWVPARDGVKVPVSLVHRKGLQRDGKAPLWLYAYGSYGIGMPAAFNASNLSLLDRGVVFAIAHIRGGDELGETWHDEGMLMKKMNTFTDFIDCAAWLTEQQWTSKDRLLIEGGSAGGLLMGAVTNLRPDLFKAVHAAVPFVDVMNTMWDASLPLTVGEYLEWGNPNEKAAYDYMRAYSPYDNLERKAYPAMLVTTSFNDSQVMYWEPAKYVARLRALKTDGNPLHLKCKMDPAGHGGASGRYDALRDRAWEVAWMLGQVGIGK